MSALRQVLTEVSTGGGTLAQVAARVGVSSDEASAMVDYWVRKGRLTVDDLGNACPSGGCGSCGSGTPDGDAGCGSAGPSDRPVLLAISVRPPDRP